MNTQIIPLAITMMAGPQIMTAIILVTHPTPVRVSVPFLVGVTVAAILETIATGRQSNRRSGWAACSRQVRGRP
jgi:small neutral amino acid transporter SnatA (MarC family)